MHQITNNFIASIGGSTKKEYRISTNCQKYNGETFATLEVAEDFSKELKQSGYSANVLNAKTGEVLFTA